MMYKVTREEMERIITLYGDMILSKYITIENIINAFSNLEVFKRNNPNTQIDYFYPKTSINGEEKIGVKYTDKEQKEHYMFFVTDLSKKEQVKRIIVGRKDGAFFNLIAEEFSDNSLKSITIMLISVHAIVKRRKGEKLSIKFRHKFETGKNKSSIEITELDLMCMQELNLSIKAFDKLFSESKLT